MQSDNITENPYTLFERWFEDAKSSEPNDPNAMCLATADARGRPTNRMVLLNGLDERGFIFYTNAESRKGDNIAENPFGAICFHWKSLRRQVRVEGAIEQVTDTESDDYYKSRPRGSRIGAWASQQSRELSDFSELEQAVTAYEKKFEGVEDIPRPEYWKGFRVLPERIEFWINGEFRLHRRYIYESSESGWRTYMINP